MKAGKLSYYSAIFAMAFCVFLLITSEFLPVSLLTPMAVSLKVPTGLMGQAVSISGFFALVASLLAPSLSRRFSPKSLLIFFACLMTLSLLTGAIASGIYIFIFSRILLGIVIGGFWALCTSVVMQIVPKKEVPKAIGIVYTGNAVAVAVAPPLSAWGGDILGWRFPFGMMAPLGMICILWLIISLPKLTISQNNVSLGSIFKLLGRPVILQGMISLMLSFLGGFCIFTYFRAFLEEDVHFSVSFLPWAFFAIGAASFIGTSLASKLAVKFLDLLLKILPLFLAVISLLLLFSDSYKGIVLGLLIFWGSVNAAIPIAWSAWLARDIEDSPEAGGGLMVAVIQMAIMAGSFAGGFLLDHFNIQMTFSAGILALLLASLLSHWKFNQKKI